MNRRGIVSALCLFPLASGRTSAAAEREKFIGVWKLTSGVATDEVTGEVRYPWGKNPVGRLIYDEAGRVFEHLMTPAAGRLAACPIRVRQRR